MWEKISETVMPILDGLDSFLYYPVLIIVLLAAGLFFSFKTKFVQVRLFKNSMKVIMERPGKDGSVSSFQALMVSTASRVGTGNIVGVATAICLGGPGAVFWMWLIAIIGGASAFTESTLAQIYKRKDSNGDSYGGPAYYIETALKNRGLAVLFAVALILTYAGGFNMLASYNLQSTFAVFNFYDKNVTSWMIGGIFAVLVGYCVMGGGKRIVLVTEKVVPLMGVIYVIVSLIVIVMHLNLLPSVLGLIFENAFQFNSAAGGIAGSAMMYGIKRGLYSNEAGVGSAPNAAASADVSHPVKQGLVQMLSVYIDTLLLCTATAFMCLFSGIGIDPELAGAPYVQASLSNVFGPVGPIFLVVAMVLFAFTTLLGNLYYVDNCVKFILKKEPTQQFNLVFRFICALLIFVGAGLPMAAVWDIADILMFVMCIINLPACVVLSKVAIDATKDYEKQLKEGKNPVFKAKDIAMDESHVEFWK